MSNEDFATEIASVIEANIMKQTATGMSRVKIRCTERRERSLQVA